MKLLPAGLADAVRDAAGFLMSVLAVDDADKPRNPWSPRWTDGFTGSGVGRGGGPTTSGITVTSGRAINQSTFYACLKIISETYARVPAMVYRDLGTDQERNRVRAPESPYSATLLQRPNEWQTPFWFQQTWAVHKMLSGDFVAEIAFDPGDGTYALVPLHPDYREIMEPVNASSAPTYRAWDKAGRERTLLRDEVIHDPLMSAAEGWKGMSVLQAAREALGIAVATQDFQAKFFKSGLTQRGVIHHPKHLTPKAKQFFEEQAKGGLAHANGMLILEEGMQFFGIALSPSDAQLLEAADMNVAVLARFFGMNHAKLGFSKEGFSYASVEQFILDFISSTMDPYFVSGEQELNRTFIVQPKTFAEFLRAALIQTDIKTRWMAYAIGLANDVYSPNDVRRLENLPLRPDGEQMKSARIAPAPAIAAHVTGWTSWEGRIAALEHKRQQARARETDTSRSRKWVEAAARTIARQERTFLAKFGSATPAAEADAFYERLARRVSRDLAVTENAALVWAEQRLQLALARSADVPTPAPVNDLVRLALEEDLHAAA